MIQRTKDKLGPNNAPNKQTTKQINNTKIIK